MFATIKKDLVIVAPFNIAGKMRTAFTQLGIFWVLIVSLFFQHRLLVSFRTAFTE